ncbi:MAG: SpoIID/LytB domain-containing protein [Microgenomates group bacterium]
MKRSIFLCLIVATIFAFVSSVHADQLDDISKQLDDLKKTFSELSKANQTNETQLQGLQKQLNDIKSKVAILEGQIETKQAQVVEGEKAFATQQKLLNQRARSYYKNMGKNSFSVVNLLLSDNISESLQNYFYQKTLVDEDKKAIVRIAIFIKQVEDKKKQLEAEKASLASVKAEVDKQSTFLATEVAKSKKYLGELQSKIASLTAQQQSIIASRQAGLNLPRSAGTSLGGCTDDRSVDPGFGNAFAFFSYGSVHRVGMNQFGAYGRAKAGQNYESILNAYYNNVKIECRDFPNGKLRVQGYGEVGINDYLKGIGEMPESWGNSGGYEALKAQVVAAASFAYAYTGGGSGEICTTQDCQVYLGNNKGGKWEAAVNDVRCGDNSARVMVSNDTGEVIKAWYASTHGGYEWTSGEIWGSQKPWTKHMQDTSSGAGSFSELNERAWDRESPWFYCDWGSRAEYNKTAWLKGEEIADIVNVILLVRADSSASPHVGQPDKPTGETWNQEKIKSELRGKNITPFNSISSVSINADIGYGKTNSITVQGDAGSQSFDGKEFKDFFNVRAPANIQIVSQLYNIEKR